MNRMYFFAIVLISFGLISCTTANPIPLTQKTLLDAYLKTTHPAINQTSSMPIKNFFLLIVFLLCLYKFDEIVSIVERYIGKNQGPILANGNIEHLFETQRKELDTIYKRKIEEITQQHNLMSLEMQAKMHSSNMLISSQSDNFTHLVWGNTKNLLATVLPSILSFGLFYIICNKFKDTFPFSVVCGAGEWVKNQAAGAEKARIEAALREQFDKQIGEIRTNIDRAMQSTEDMNKKIGTNLHEQEKKINEIHYKFDGFVKEIKEFQTELGNSQTKIDTLKTNNDLILQRISTIKISPSSGNNSTPYDQVDHTSSYNKNNLPNGTKPQETNSMRD